jgi:hypothetical protein
MTGLRHSDSPRIGFTPWMAARARRLRVGRRIVNSIWVIAAVILVINAVRWSLPPSAWPVSIAFGAYLFTWLFLASGFYYGSFRCPSCDIRFAPKFPPMWVPRKCQNCGFDIYTLEHPAAN